MYIKHGKQLDMMHGLNTYDYGARQYDPILGRWDRMDPMCEKYYNVSPYAYCHSNPVMLVDPDGRDDYYDRFGNFLGTNGKKTDYIFIANRYTYDKSKGLFYIKDRTALANADLNAKVWSKILTKTLSMMEGVDVKELEGGAVSVLKVSPGNGNTINFETFNNPDMNYGCGSSIYNRHSAINPDLQPFKYNGKELDMMHGLNTYDYGARQYAPTLGRWDRMDPMCEKYYSVSPYAYCHNNPVMLVDPDGRQVVADLNSINSLMRIVPENAMKFISFNSNGVLDANLLARYEGKSYIMNSLKALSESEVCYIFESAAYDDNGKQFIDKDDNYYRGVTEFPRADNNASPDDDVHVIVGSNLSQEQQCLTIAHEGLGHGYVYELTRSATKSSHHYKNKKGNEYEFEGQKYYELIRVDDNELLNKQIRDVTEEAKRNYKIKY